MKNIFGKILFPLVLIIIGITLVYLAYSTDQNWQFKFAAFFVFISSVVFLLNVLDNVKKNIRIGIFILLGLSALGLSFLNYRSIKDPIDFGKEKDRRYAVVVQRLKDIRVAQLAIKGVHGKYAGNFDDLLKFIQTDSIPVIKAIGTVPDSLTEEQALKKGLVKRDTSYVIAKDSIFSPYYLKERGNSFSIDSIPFIPFGNGSRFEINSGEIERNKVKVQVFEVVARKTAILNDLDPTLTRGEIDLKVGSMIDPNTSGNWGE